MKLILAATQTFSDSDDVPLARGFDWVLTNNHIFMVSDESPHIFMSKLFDADIPDTFLYSVLRNKNIGTSGFDPLTHQAWGMRSDNGNSEGIGRFSKNTHMLYPAGTHIFEQCYSLLPSVGDWQIFENFLIRRPDASSSGSYNSMYSLRPLIPLELSRGTATYGTGYNFDHRGIQLFHKDGEIWGKGAQVIGKVSILPAVFDEYGTVQEYYLYIQPDFTFYPYSDFFYCNIKTFDVNPDKELLDDEGFTSDYEPILHFFAVSTIARTWAEAKAICEALGGHLATSTSDEKNTFLTTLTTAEVWLGGTDEAEEGNNNSASTALRYICEWDYAIDENEFLGYLWPNISIASIGDNSVYGFLPEQADALSSGACFTANNTKLFSPQNNEWINLSEHEGKVFIDTVNSQALILYEKGAGLVHDVGSPIDDYQCNNLPQWIVPAGKVEAVTSDYVVASADKSSFCTSLVTGFNRQVISPCALPLSGMSFTDRKNSSYRFAIQESTEDDKKTLAIHHLPSGTHGIQNVDWTNIYKEAIAIKLDGFEYELYVDDSGSVIHLKYGHSKWESRKKDDGSGDIDITYLRYDNEPNENEEWAYPLKYIDSVSLVLTFYDKKDSYVAGPFHIDFTLPNVEIMETETREYGNDTVIINRLSKSSKIYGPMNDDNNQMITGSAGIESGNIVYVTPEFMTDTWAAFPVCTVSSLIPGYKPDTRSYSEDYSKIRFVRALEDNRFFLFEEVNSKVIFVCDISGEESLVTFVQGAHIYDVMYNYTDPTSDLIFCRIHLDGTNGSVFLTFQINLHPEVFSFQQELERSNQT